MWIDRLWQDIRYALRIMRKQLGFTMVAVLSLALGVGAPTMVFWIMDALVFKPLPVAHPEELVAIPRSLNGPDVYTYAIWRQIRDQVQDQQDVLSGVYAYGHTTFSMAIGGTSQSIAGIYASGDYFSTLGVHPILGRTLERPDDVPGAPLVCVISYGFWQRRYSKAPDVVGKTLSLDGWRFEVVGVTPQSFHGIDVGETFDVIAPLESERIVDGKRKAIDAPRSLYWLPPIGPALGSPTSWWLTVGGRLKSGIDAERATARLGALSAAIVDTAAPTTAANKHLFSLAAIPIPNGFSYTRDLYEESMIFMMMMGMIVLVVACANLANLLLARSEIRQPELATRIAHGATRSHLLRQLLTESMALSVTGTILGVAIAERGTKLLVPLICDSISGAGAQYLDLYPDKRFVLFAIAIAILTGLLVGAVPGIRATQSAPFLTMKSASNGVTRRGSYGSVLIVVQVMLSMTALVGAGLLLRTVHSLLAQDQGFDPKNVLTIEPMLTSGGISLQGQMFINDQLLTKFRSMPGVLSAARFARARINSLNPNMIVRTRGGADLRYVGLTYYTSPGFFETRRTPIVAGRDFNESDNASSTAVAIVTESTANKFFPGLNPLGQTYRPLDNNGIATQTPIEIVGVAKDYRQMVRSDEKRFAVIYRPVSQCSFPCPSFGKYELRFTGPSTELIARATETAATVNSHLSLQFGFLADEVDSGYQKDRVSAMLATWFGLLTLGLAATGIYGVTSYVTSRRTNEIGVRIALGAQPGDIIRMILGGSFRGVSAGVILGVISGALVAQSIRDVLYGVSPMDSLTSATSALLMLAVALIAALIPSLRALKTDPCTALRAE